MVKRSFCQDRLGTKTYGSRKGVFRTVGVVAIEANVAERVVAPALVHLKLQLRDVERPSDGRISVRLGVGAVESHRWVGRGGPWQVRLGALDWIAKAAQVEEDHAAQICRVLVHNVQCAAAGSAAAGPAAASAWIHMVDRECRAVLRIDSSSAEARQVRRRATRAVQDDLVGERRLAACAGGASAAHAAAYRVQRRVAQSAAACTANRTAATADERRWQQSQERQQSQRGHQR
eukprot:COSAG06_NODE_1883_length_8145_cov_21.194009_3_plen_233_part_00